MRTVMLLMIVGKASGMRTLRMIWKGVAPWIQQLRRAVIDVADRRFDEAAEEGDGDDGQGHAAAAVPMDVPATSRVKGMMATMRMMKGTERMMLTMVPKIRLMKRFCRMWPLLVVTKVTPRGMPMMPAMTVARDHIERFFNALEH